ncbi:endospore germination permease [Paenibacillus sp. LHD-38]|uniref:GerAB/ArcD/ProY family transporter n=1 Tax=Paenibacillus sp. LHD-38 TaxID=3072143 RepID=UPI00280F7EF4|nr:endospore germination permease [Paenibacillus sp. LHD-38]MDQ8737219.1 endospore germination permease [Paenibacillus sp. LHD-38]
MDLKKLSGLQLFYIMIGFEIGNTIIFAIGAGAKQDAWLAILTAMFCGLLLMGIYIKLSAYFPNDSLVQMLPKIIGRFLSYPIIFIYILYFTYLASTACRDFGELIASTILTETPLLIVVGSFMVLMIYSLRGGTEVFGRMGEMVFPVYILVLVAMWVLMAISLDQFDLKRLTPVLGEGIFPVLNEVFPYSSPSILVFPFGETVLITMFFPLLKKKENAKKVGIAVILLGGLLLSINCIIMISVLGPNIFEQEYFPLLSAARMVSIADFLERFDSLIILMMVAGVFFKVGAWTLGASIAIGQLFKLKSNKTILLILGVIIAPFAVIHAPNFVKFLEIGRTFIDPYLHVPLQIVIPFLLLSIAFVRKKFQT